MDTSLETIDALARLQLAVRRLGSTIRVVDPPPELRELIVLVGLEDVLGVEPRRQPEQREDRVGVEEERDLPDPAP
jgi:anti-anti-sigma regulatory factor